MKLQQVGGSWSGGGEIPRAAQEHARVAYCYISPTSDAFNGPSPTSLYVLTADESFQCLYCHLSQKFQRRRLILV